MAKSFEYFVLLGGQERSHTKIQSSSGNFSKHSNFDWSFDTAGLHSHHSCPYESHLFTRN
jgi:hypothetical protein